MTIRIANPDAVHLKWTYNKSERVHRCMSGTKEVGTVTLSPPHVSPTLYTWAITGRGETGKYTTLRNAKRRVENKIFELALESRAVKQRNKPHDNEP